ncbi:hypothetical protein [Ramlibacter sp. PS4R-6]|uniref:hypothetical protein n=1 Tax=Ramlibacter sp. PS4R-6 TaxID=3133438 RepID=UPI0030AB5ADC
MRRPIPDDVRRFVLTSVGSVPFLEALLLLRAHPDEGWSPSELARRLYVAPPLGEELLAQLVDAGLASTSGDGKSWRWNAGTALSQTIDELAGIYSENVVDVTELIHSRQERRAHQFADAFLLRRKEG